MEPSAYPGPYDILLSQWAWEFLRRNPRYQQDWAEKAEPVVTSRGEYDKSLISKELDAEIKGIEQKYGIMMVQDPKDGRWPAIFRSEFVTTYECPNSVGSIQWTIKVIPGELYVKFDLKRSIGAQIVRVHFIPVYTRACARGQRRKNPLLRAAPRIRLGSEIPGAVQKLGSDIRCVLDDTGIVKRCFSARTFRMYLFPVGGRPLYRS
jgi:hypothetical protein